MLNYTSDNNLLYEIYFFQMYLVYELMSGLYITHTLTQQSSYLEVQSVLKCYFH